MTTYNFTPTTSKNHGIAIEWGVCSYYKIKRIAHDSNAYDKDSDINMGNKHISIKSSKFTLMSGSLCENKTSFDEIWKLYESKVHSNTFVYGTKNGKAYEMNLQEFKQFVYTFCTLEKESAKNGSQVKIRCRAESKKMLQWLETRV